MNQDRDTAGWRLAVGQPFIEGITSWPSDRFEYRVWNGNHMLQLCYSQLTERSIQNFMQSPVQVGLAKLESTLFLLFRIDGFIDWSDQAFSLRLIENDEDRQQPKHEAGTHQVLSLVLVEAETGIVRGMRVVTWSKHASAVLHRLLNEQLDDSAWTPELHAQRVRSVYARYPKSKDIVRAALLTERAGRDI